MYAVEYYHADTGKTDEFWSATERFALALLDKMVLKSEENVKKVAKYRVEFANGDSIFIADLDPLCPLMLGRTRRGYINDGSDSIFDD